MPIIAHSGVLTFIVIYRKRSQTKIHSIRDNWFSGDIWFWLTLSVFVRYQDVKAIEMCFWWYSTNLHKFYKVSATYRHRRYYLFNLSFIYNFPLLFLFFFFEFLTRAISAFTRNDESRRALTREASFVILTSTTLAISQQTLVNVLASASLLRESRITGALVSVLCVYTLPVSANVRSQRALVYRDDRLQLLQAKPVVIVYNWVITRIPLLAITISIICAFWVTLFSFVPLERSLFVVSLLFSYRLAFLPFYIPLPWFGQM